MVLQPTQLWHIETTADDSFGISFADDGLARTSMNKAMEGEDRPGPRQGKAGPGLYPPPFLGPAPHTDMQFYQVIKATALNQQDKN